MKKATSNTPETSQLKENNNKKQNNDLQEIKETPKAKAPKIPHEKQETPETKEVMSKTNKTNQTDKTDKTDKINDLEKTIETELKVLTETKSKPLTSKKFKKPFVLQHPGRLTHQVQLTLNTMDAQNVFAGSQPANSIGLLAFGGRMTQIWQAAALDDPFADLFLLRVYDALVKGQNQLSTTLQDYTKKLNSLLQHPNIRLQPLASEKPIVKILWFSTPYGYLGANLIADFDRLMCLDLTAYRVGILLDKTHEILKQQSGEIIQSIFKLPFQWIKTNVTRKDIQLNNELAKTAIEKMGVLPEAVFNKELRSPFSPEIKGHT